MRAEWVERMHDQARTEMGFCVQAPAEEGNWCDAHDAGKWAGDEACKAMRVAYDIAESAGEVMADLIATEIRAEGDRFIAGLRDFGDALETGYDAATDAAVRIARGGA